VAETSLAATQLIYPVFVTEGTGRQDPIAQMPGQFRWSVDALSRMIAEWKALGLTHYALFPHVPEAKKDARATEALNDHGLLPQALRRLKADHPDVMLITDVALDPYSSDGHDGLVQGGEIINDPTVELLARMAVKHAGWGADWVAPSDMMDGRVGAIRRALDEHGHHHVNILAYTAKYASAFYGPFRSALESAPRSGDKKTYQMDPRNAREAEREARLDAAEGADMLMVKPGLAYLDVVARLRAASDLPIAVYQVSGEYLMITAAAAAGALDETAAILETLTSFRRAGASAVLTYFAPEAARLLRR
jgi:porphobilinogen synthase